MVLVLTAVVNGPSQTTHGFAPSVVAYEVSSVAIEALIVARFALATVLAAEACDFVSSALADAVTKACQAVYGVFKFDVSVPVLRVVAASKMALIGQLV